jgi:hypothetical protein
LATRFFSVLDEIRRIAGENPDEPQDWALNSPVAAVTDGPLTMRELTPAFQE